MRPAPRAISVGCLVAALLPTQDGGPFTRAPGTAFRVLSWNVDRTAHIRERSAFRALVGAADPDLLLLSEVADTTSPAAVRAALWGLRGPADTVWHVSFGRGGGYQRSVIAARTPVTTAPAFDSIPYPASDRTVLLGLVPDSARAAGGAALAAGVGTNAGIVRIGGRRVMVVVADFQCCGGSPTDWREQRRRIEARILHRAMRTTLAGARADAVILGADLNLVTGGAPLDTLLQPLDRRLGALAATAPKHLDGSQDWTWRGVDSPFPPARLDYVLYSARTLVVRRSFVLETEDLDPDERERRGLESGTSQRLSDHRPIVADFAWAP
jgi:endonuclease/exonuclease/phosphatase family metal-dependent hydrolase